MFALSCALALAAGCASTGGLQSTAKPMPVASLKAQKSLAGLRLEAGVWPKSEWWKPLHNAELDQLVATALGNNPDMALVEARVQAALAAAGAADAVRRPTLNAGASIAGARFPPILPPIANGAFGTIRYGYLSFKWDLDLWGGKRAAWEAAVGTARAAEVDADAARLRLSADVVQAYFNLAAACAQRDLARQELQRAQDFQTLTRKRVTSGIESRFSLVRIESETAGDRVRLEAARNSVHASGLVLAAVLGEGPDAALAIPEPKLAAVPLLALPSTLPAELLGRRPDVVAARWQVEAASKGIQSAKTRFLPNISVSALVGLFAPSSIDLFSLGSRFYDVAPALSLPIFDGGALRANLAGKDAARDIAVAHYNQTLVHAINQVALQADDLRSLGLQVQAARSARVSAAEAYRLSMQRFRAGIGSFLEALTVRQQLIEAEQQLTELELARNNAWALLNEALGGGFEPSADAPSLAAAPASHSEPGNHP
ncbi:MAG: efflux transporter outer membrane subunit [Gammaproteobacteria bacterium]